MVPNGWCEHTLDELALVERGKFSARPRNDPRYYGGHMPFVQTGDVTSSGTYLNGFSQTLNEDGVGVSKVFPKDTILITIAANIGDTAITAFEVACPDSVVAIQPYKDVADVYWLKKHLETRKADLDAQSTQNAQKNINLQVLKPLLILTPPLLEQKKIAQILSIWDKSITTTEQLLANSQQQKKALMQQLLTGKKRLLDKNGVRFGGEWTSYLLDELEALEWVVLGRGNVISKKDIENIPGDYPIYSSSVKNSGLMGKYGEYMFDEELISWSVDGGGNFFYRPKHKFSVTNVSGYMRLNTEKLNYQFIAAQLELHHSRLEFDYQSKAHPSVIRKTYTLTIPSLDEQQKIAAVLSTADQEISALQQKLDALKQEKKALMQQLLTGKRRVTVEEAA